MTHLLQPLDVDVFGPLKQNYKKLLSKKTYFTTYNIDKADFISLIQKARRQGITSRNIKSAWWATRLILYNPTVVFQKLSVHANNISISRMDNTRAGSSTFLQTRFFLVAILQTPGNIEQVTEIEELILLFQNQTLDLPKLTLLHKTFKAAMLAMADRVVLNCTNTELLATNTQKNGEYKIQYDGQSTCVLSPKDNEERRQQVKIKRKDKKVKKLAQKGKQDN